LPRRPTTEGRPDPRGSGGARASPGPGGEPRPAPDALLHELQVHQVELEMQNEELRRSHLALEEARDRYVDLYDFAPVAYLTVSAAGTVLDANLTCATLLGVDRAKLRGKPFVAFVQPDDADRWHALLRSPGRPAGADGSLDLRIRRADGTVLHGQLVVRREVRGEELLSLRIALSDASEIRALQAKLALASRLAAMGTLVAGIGHEINNPLAAQMAGQGLALEVAEAARKRILAGEGIDLAAAARDLDYVIGALTDAQEGSLRIAGIVKDMAAFTRPDPRRTRVALRAVVTDAMRWLPASVSQAATIEVEDRGSPDVLVAAGQITQVVVNLVQNAAQATPPGEKGIIVVRTATGSAGQATIEVVDRGVGMTPAMLDRIFEPFFTTRPTGAGRGTGLGLAISHAIVTAHGGLLLVQSRPGEGSTFRVELPAAPDAPDAG